MMNVLRLLKRDILRLLKTPAALVVVGALLVLPSVYTWYNVLGFWNPYDNTGNLKVCVVNQDAGGTSDLTGEMDVGDMIVEQLQQNDQLDWQFVGYDEALSSLESGACYAAFVIPEDFTSSLLAMASGNTDKPDIIYYVNEKTGPVAPKITDAGATTLDETINATFVSTVSDVVTKSIDEAVQEAKTSIEGGASEALRKSDEALAKIAEAKQSIASVADSANAAKGDVSTAKGSLSSAESKIGALAAQIPHLRETADNASGRISDFTNAAMEAHQAVLSAMANLEGLVPDDDYQRLRQEADRISGILNDGMLPAASNAIAALQSASGTVEGALNGQRAMTAELRIVLDELDGVLDAALDSLSQTTGLLDDAYGNMEGMRSDLVSLSQADALTKLFGEEGLDAERIASFMGSPTKVVTEQMYYLNAYGSAMAPLFMNLTFWIGAFMLLVIMRQEVDSEGIKNLTLTQRYVGRYALFAILATLQAVICVAGVLLLGVEAASPPALFAASIIASLSYLSIIYALSVTFQHIGKGICIVLVFAQIPGATGLYPIEMTPDFFQAVYPWLPFTYGISAMRESIFGFYGMQYAQALLMLGLFFAVFMLLGILLRPVTGNVNRMVASEVRQSGIYNGEDVQIPVRSYRASQMVKLLANQEEFRNDVLARYERFERWYPKLIKGSIVLGILVPLALVLVFALTPAEKVVLLTIWLLYVIVTLIFLIAVETLRFSFRRQLKLGGMGTDKVIDLYSRRERMEYSRDEGGDDHE